ncbi:MAG: class I SAM-dependent methyltransferase [Okeania sp. SIO2G4]|uniref:class I SAM-dependent methyltransferase n=1 Tax=unclassified Okeania TaxID=2634635 RepID=UPI0013BDCC05|nr:MULTISPECIES: class I SAM-dependent methyltransferase [unclassified Okeania]NEP41854.1 class I SAM-dependent methyltransferase [Okeania sp. SIO2H7]NEP73136.1 class I SAM-dependent methyltransferase [Okeania sp. SIO2G5]NEP93959.1 class I SAM-dependent methyltransferase [Okeania sp. SIO2F5]NEQ94212.1 class I SAM-dependent methyltransferase [Okeania sp. SIO2G4]
MDRILEPEVMDTWEEAEEYDSMDFLEVNQAFAESSIEIGPKKGLVLDVGTGTARIPILICQQQPEWQIIGIDLSKNMLTIGERNIEKAQLQSQVKLELVDAKKIPYSEHSFEMVISNSIVHHLSEPLLLFQEVKRVLQPQGGIFIRDLLRPETPELKEELVDKYARDCNQHQQKLFRDSLQAALTIVEVEKIVKDAGIKEVKIYQSSDRHWTAERKWSKTEEF